MDKKQQTIDTYNKSAKSLAAKFDEIGARVKDIEEAFSHCKKDNPKVLEIGCGNGRDAKEILKHTNNYLGIDISKGLIEIAKLNLPNAKFQIADIEECKFPNGLDIIFSFASLIHSNEGNFKNVLNKLHETLNKNGIIYIALKHGKYGELTRKDGFGTRTYYFYDKEKIKELIGNLYIIKEENVYELRGQAWMKLILEKVEI